MLNTLSSVSVRESRIQYLCDPQWFRDTASRGPTTIVAPESQFRTCPSDHDSIGYPRMSASGEFSTTMHRLLHASGSHPIPPPNDPSMCLHALLLVYTLLCITIEHAEPLGSLGLNGAGDDPVDEHVPTGEHAEPLGSLGLNGAGDDPVDEHVPTGGEDL
ncbi:hypothetical protein F511_20968 [Dorcoceras hygrometricum]|uniref:Uncharacterized protein n=1 Tax=Dorcoceras hygrometricum TaxID=472368 RepID=A0A2Z7AC07_9LAMI|nr:hypothetical protein F511_20968 [Dorcoceras hygrometricum]